MKIEEINIDEIKEYSRNTKAHPKEQIEKIKRSIEEFGFNVPLILDKDNVLIAGHGRVYAAKELGLKKLPIIRKSDLSKAQIKAYRIADNKIAESGWIFDNLVAEIQDLNKQDFDLSILGFTDLQLESYLDTEIIDINKEYEGMPSYNAENLDAYQSIILHFKDAKDRDAFAELVNDTITDKTKFLWYPKREDDKVADLRY